MTEATKKSERKRRLHQLPDEYSPIAEIIDGKLIELSPPNNEHQATSVEIIALVRTIIGRSGTLRHTPAGVVLPSTILLHPDVFYISHENKDCVISENGYWYGPPNLVVEILSPDTELRDRGIKYDLYENHGVGELWLVQPSYRFIEVFVREDNRFRRKGFYDGASRFFSPSLQSHIEVSEIFPLS